MERTRRRRTVHGGAHSTPAVACAVERTRHSTLDGAWRSALDASGGMHGGANSTPAAAVPWKVVVMLADVSEAAAPVGALPREGSE